MSKPAFKRQVEVPLYYSWLMVIVADTIELAHAEAQKHHEHALPDYGSNGAARCNFGPGCRFSLSFVRGQIEHRYFAHELYHLTSKILQSVGIIHDPDNHEAGAYLCGWLADWTCKQLAKAGEKIQS